MFMMGTAMYADDVMKKQSDGTYVVNTTTLCKAKGFKGTTPVEVHIKDGKVVKVVSLSNAETKKYYAKVEKNLVGKFADWQWRNKNRHLCF